ncbi:hypothetical protein [Methylocystis suflitae]|uniref:hypothetical protein n=1 Tax=Methylocystis suflitae TaxID=2951405 RepID=UPI00210CF5F8|nr:hypothetical protein [Methylocystis suflitae]MCQ4188120.1 hypothetical protein [Methylocystis suflitae]
MSDPVAALLGLDGIEAKVKRTIDTVALFAAGKSSDVRAGAVTWFKQELIDGLGACPEFAGKDLGALADSLAERLVKRIDEIEASVAGSA